jgi:hypothetical protein
VSEKLAVSVADAEALSVTDFVADTDGDEDVLLDRLHDKLWVIVGVPSDVLGLQVKLCDGVPL